MESAQVPVIEVGAHRRVVRASHFNLKEEEIAGYKCLNCDTWRQAKEELKSVNCRPR